MSFRFNRWSSLGAGGLSGILLASSFPRFDVELAAWVALVPLLYHAFHATPRSAMASGAVAGLTFHLLNLYWISEVMVRYGGLGRLPSIGILVLLVGYLTLYLVVFAGLAAAASRLGVLAAFLLIPFVWVGLEVFRFYPFGGFPWSLLGYSQVGVPPVIQWAAVAGIHGLSYVIVLVNVLLVFLLTVPGARRGTAAALPVAALLAGVLAYGFSQLSRPLPEPELRVAAVQGRVLQENKWDPAYADRIFADHLRLSRRAVENGARLILWPESSTPFVFDRAPAFAERMRALAREEEAYLLFGSDDVEALPADGNGDGVDYAAYNGAKLLTPGGDVSLRYHKIHLVPFGEYVPLRPLLSFAGSIAEVVGDFRPGTEVAVAAVDGGKAGAFICYEAIYPGLVRAFVREGAGLLVNLTNDAWFGTTAAPYQHFQMAIARAVETRRYLVRAANTGISAVVDPYGRVLEKSDLFTQEVVFGDISFLEETTPFVRFGDVVGRGGAVLTVLFVALVAIRSRRRG